MIRNTPYSAESSKEEFENARKQPIGGSLAIALRMLRGAYLRIYHPDVFCDGHQCNLRSALGKRSKEGKWRFRHTRPEDAYLYREE